MKIKQFGGYKILLANKVFQNYRKAFVKSTEVM
jgi:hypothetical protein